MPFVNNKIILTVFSSPVCAYKRLGVNMKTILGISHGERQAAVAYPGPTYSHFSSRPSGCTYPRGRWSRSSSKFAGFRRATNDLIPRRFRLLLQQSSHDARLSWSGASQIASFRTPGSVWLLAKITKILLAKSALHSAMQLYPSAGIQEGPEMRIAGIKPSCSLNPAWKAMITGVVRNIMLIFSPPKFMVIFPFWKTVLLKFLYILDSYKYINTVSALSCAAFFGFKAL